ncbi:MAG: hypothetical protein LBE85_11485 [Candidatus Accumulibacter sp.]|nr:hypothetical protein [Accumulibacter sp.]
MTGTLASPRFRLLPVSLRTANAFLQEHPRHHRPVPGAQFALAVGREDDPDGRIVGVAIVGRPVARHLDDGTTLEVTRLCTDGTVNTCSKLYAAACRAAGWRLVGLRGGGNWNHPGRPRRETPEALRGPKWLWEAR